MSPTCPVMRKLWVPQYLPIILEGEQILSLLIWLSAASAEKRGVKASLESWKGYRVNSSHLKSPNPTLRNRMNPKAEDLRVLSNCIKSVWTVSYFSLGTNPFQPLPGSGDLDWWLRFSMLWNSFLEKHIGTAHEALGEFFHLGRDFCIVQQSNTQGFGDWRQWELMYSRNRHSYIFVLSPPTRIPHTRKLSALLSVLVRKLGRGGLLWIMYRQAARSQTSGEYMEKTS